MSQPFLITRFINLVQMNDIETLQLLLFTHQEVHQIPSGFAISKSAGR
jgi:hypothetical protein